MNWWASFFGLDSGNSFGYLFWSGIGAIFIQPTVIALALGFWWHHNCHVHGCWRYGKHKSVGNSGTEYRLCRKHHPFLTKKTTHQQVLDDHKGTTS